MHLCWKMTPPIYVMFLTSLMTSQVWGRTDPPPPHVAKNDDAASGGNNLLERILRDSGEQPVDDLHLFRRNTEAATETSTTATTEVTEEVTEQSTEEAANSTPQNGNGGSGSGNCKSENFCEKRKKENLCHYYWPKKYCKKSCGKEKCKSCVDRDLCPIWKSQGWCNKSSGGYRFMQQYCKSFCPGLC